MGASGAIQLTLTTGGLEIPLGVTTTTTDVWARTKALDLGDDTIRKQIQCIILKVRGRSNFRAFRMRILSSDNVDDAFVEEVDLTLSSDDDPIWYQTNGRRYYKFEFRDSSVSGEWKMSSIEVLGVAAGKML